MFNDKTIEVMTPLMHDNGKVTGFSILFTDGIEIVIDENLDLYSRDEESQRFGWVHPSNIGR